MKNDDEGLSGDNTVNDEDDGSAEFHSKDGGGADRPPAQPRPPEKR